MGIHPMLFLHSVLIILDHPACSEVGVRTKLNNWHRYFQSPLNPITNTAIDTSLQNSSSGRHSAMGSMHYLDLQRRLVSGKAGVGDT